MQIEKDLGELLLWFPVLIHRRFHPRHHHHSHSEMDYRGQIHTTEQAVMERIRVAK
jgi:hypothetical protein